MSNSNIGRGRSDDRLDGAASERDILEGERGNDTYVVDDVGDIVIENALTRLS